MVKQKSSMARLEEIIHSLHKDNDDKMLCVAAKMEPGSSINEMFVGITPATAELFVEISQILGNGLESGMALSGIDFDSEKLPGVVIAASPKDCAIEKTMINCKRNFSLLDADDARAITDASTEKDAFDRKFYFKNIEIGQYGIEFHMEDDTGDESICIATAELLSALVAHDRQTHGCATKMRQ